MCGNFLEDIVAHPHGRCPYAYYMPFIAPLIAPPLIIPQLSAANPRTDLEHYIKAWPNAAVKCGSECGWKGATKDLVDIRGDGLVYGCPKCRAEFKRHPGCAVP